MNIQADARKALEEFLMDIEILEPLERIISEFNVFEALGIIHTEIRHSKVLSWLLDPAENHGLGDYVLKKLIQTAGFLQYEQSESKQYDPLKLSLLDYRDFEVRREWKNIDILLLSKSNKLVVAIENKVWSKESKHQLKKYHNIVQVEFRDYDKLFIFLTPYGEEASDPDTWISMSYLSIIGIIEKALSLRKDALSERVRLFIEQYIETLRRYIVGDRELEQICRQIYNKHKKALDLIFEYKPDLYSDISNDLQEFIKNTPGLILDDSNKTYIRFTTELLDKHFGKNGSGWTSSNRLLLFEFQNRDNKLVLKLIIGPGDQETRERLYHAAVSHKEIFDPAGKLTRQFTQIFKQEFLTKYFDEEYDYEEIKKQIEVKFSKFLENDLVKIHECLLKV